MPTIATECELICYTTVAASTASVARPISSVAATAINSPAADVDALAAPAEGVVLP